LHPTISGLKLSEAAFAAGRQRSEDDPADVTIIFSAT